MRDMRNKGPSPPNQVVLLREIVVSKYLTFDQAWSVSLHPSGTTYASTGGSGNVNIYSADRQTFGEHLSKLESGRSKFGMCTVYVCCSLLYLYLLVSDSQSKSPDGSRIALSTETGQIYIFDTQSNSLVSTYTSHAMTVRSLAWSADSQVCFESSACA